MNILRLPINNLEAILATEEFFKDWTFECKSYWWESDDVELQEYENIIMKTPITIKYLDDENTSIVIGDVDICHLSHDSDGWFGMEKIITIVKKIAYSNNIPVVEEYEVSEE